MALVERALGHPLGHRGTDRGAFVDHLAADAEQLALGLLGIDDEATLERVGTARHVGQQRGEQPAGAALRHGERVPVLAQSADEGFLQGLAVAGEQVFAQSREDDGFRAFQEVGCADAAQVHFSQPRAVPDF